MLAQGDPSYYEAHDLEYAEQQAILAELRQQAVQHLTDLDAERREVNAFLCSLSAGEVIYSDDPFCAEWWQTVRPLSEQPAAAASPASYGEPFAEDEADLIPAPQAQPGWDWQPPFAAEVDAEPAGYPDPTDEQLCRVR
jgi:hypothetical protein